MTSASYVRIYVSLVPRPIRHFISGEADHAVNIDPSGELTVEEGDNVTVTCTSNIAGALLQLLILMDRFTSSHSVVASAEDTVLSHTFYFILM